jgi:hypothetical protein
MILSIYTLNTKDYLFLRHPNVLLVLPGFYERIKPDLEWAALYFPKIKCVMDPKTCISRNIVISIYNTCAYMATKTLIKYHTCHQ